MRGEIRNSVRSPTRGSAFYDIFSPRFYQVSTSDALDSFTFAPELANSTGHAYRVSGRETGK